MLRARLHTLLSLSVLVGTAATPLVAHAEPSAADRQAATVLFKDGKALFDKGQTAEACRKLEGSLRLDPAAGTLLNLAVCHEKEGRTASAWYEFTDALAAARRDNRPERIKLAEEHIAKLEPQLVRLTIEVPKESDLPELSVLRDEAILARAGWGSATPVDPGEHKIEAKAPGKIAWSQIVKVDGSQPTKTVKVPALAVDPDAVKAAAAPPKAETVPPPVAPPPITEPPSMRRRNGIITTAVGGAVLVGAGVAGLLAKSKWDDAQKDCGRADSCTQAGSDATKSAGKLADAGTALGVVGAIVAGVGVYMMATAPSDPPKSSAARRPSRVQIVPSVAHDHAGAFVSGSF